MYCYFFHSLTYIRLTRHDSLHSQLHFPRTNQPQTAGVSHAAPAGIGPFQSVNSPIPGLPEGPPISFRPVVVTDPLASGPPSTVRLEDVTHTGEMASFGASRQRRWPEPLFQLPRRTCLPGLLTNPRAHISPAPIDPTTTAFADATVGLGGTGEM